MPDDDAMDTAVVCGLLNEALLLQYRSALGYTVAAGSLRGVAYHGVASALGEWAVEELRGVRLLVEKIIALGGRPVTEPPGIPFDASGETVIRQLIDNEREAVRALHAVIPESGQEPRSEALEHVLEHEIMRKQRHLDTLRRAVETAA